ncbi:hypothetical protein CALVIDRAFT_540096 [Calocera viscosa TUFC12733]|uniref:Uncharacterized protein n=1 Tax=Calocera viscosa (strain TUFC12733) TaxID=1330018 RepID=A0A167J9F4_CALVF|nr:hypothetical protein CALVIDRAFT_540096 [Calocera viscosa TUFC12733]
MVLVHVWLPAAVIFCSKVKLIVAGLASKSTACVSADSKRMVNPTLSPRTHINGAW